jgi:hypothetical protein
MSTKAKTTKAKKDPMQQKPAVSYARHGHELASLLWQKIRASSTPEVREMLTVFSHLDWIWDQLAPSDFERVIRGPLTHESLNEYVNKAEYLLTGATPKNISGLPAGYEYGRDDERTEEASLVDAALYKQLYLELSDDQREILDQIYTHPTKDAEPFKLYGWLKRARRVLNAEDKKTVDDLISKKAGR